MRGLWRLFAAAAAVGLSIWLIVSLLLAPVTASVGLLPQLCGQPLSSPLSSNNGYDIYYRVSGCQAVSTGTAGILSAQLPQLEQSLTAMGLATPPKPIAVEVIPQGTLKVYLGHHSNPGALLLPSSASPLAISQALAELSLGYSLPGLSSHSRERLALAFAVYVRGNPLSEAASGSAGLYDAWLMARYGPSVVRQALGACQDPCSWPRTLNHVLRQRHLNPSALESQFTGGADTSYLEER